MPKNNGTRRILQQFFPEMFSRVIPAFFFGIILASVLFPGQHPDEVEGIHQTE